MINQETQRLRAAIIRAGIDGLDGPHDIARAMAERILANAENTDAVLVQLARDFMAKAGA